jgi:hypothetical protein
MSNSITFNSDGSIFSLDGTELNRAVRPANAMSDTAKAGVNTTNIWLAKSVSRTSSASWSMGRKVRPPRLTS